MGGLLSRYPPLRAQAAHRAQTRLFARFCVRCLRARVVRPCASFVPVAPARARVFPRSHILLAHALWRGRSLCSLGGVPWQGLVLWACLVLWVAGVWCLRYCPCSLVVFACLLVCARLGVVGQCGIAAPSTSACLLACSRAACGRCWRVRGLCVPVGGGRLCGGGTWLSRPHALLGGAAAVAWRGEREKGGVLLGAVNTAPRPLLCSPTWKRVATLLVLNKEGEPPSGRVLAWAGVGGDLVRAP